MKFLIALFCLTAAPAFAVTRYVAIANPTPAPPYDTWATAATNIRDAINVASAGETVLVTNGVYDTGIQPGYTATSNRVVINKSVAIRSVSGPAETVIVGAPDPAGGHGLNSVRCVYVAAGAVLDGFTLTNGYTRAITGSRTLSERGGGVWCETGAVLTNCVIVGNRADDDGGGVYGGTLYRCLITGNSTQESVSRDGDGGGADHATLYNCVVSNNRGRKGGGVDDCMLLGCVLLGNNGRVFGGGAARSRLWQCTVVDNNSRHGGGVEACDVYNSIVYHNRAAVGPNYEPPFPWSDAGPAFYFSCTTPLPERGAMNTALDPQLASWTHLSSNSPCREAGSPFYIMDALDLDGQPFSNPPSMGADELTDGMALGALSVTIASDFPRVAVGFAARFKLQVDGETTGTSWDFGDGTLVTNQLIVSHAWSSTGTYPVRLTAWNSASGAAGVTATAVVNVVTVPTAYVNRANSSPAFPYNSWASAAADIQSAIAVTNVAGRVVLVTNGVYDTGGVAVWGSMTNRVALSNGVVVRSVSDPRFTILRGAPAPNTSSVGDGAIRCAYVGDSSVLDGFTLTNGFTRQAGHSSREQGGGGAWCESRGVMTNCVLTGNTAGRDGGGANGGIFYNCKFEANRALEKGGAVDDAILFDCVVFNNAAPTAGGAREAELHRSTLISNRCDYGAAGAAESTLQQCLVEGNVVAAGTGGGAQGCALFNCVIRGNGNAGQGSGAGASSCTLVNCTVVGNGGIIQFGGSAVQYSWVRNSIVYYNSPPDTGNGVTEYSCSPGLPSSNGNITDAPQFVDLALGDFRLHPGSPAIDTGRDLSFLILSDIDGVQRPLDGNRDGVAGFDMGAYEFNPLFFTSVSRTNNNVRLDWFDSLPGMKLQTSPALPAPVWTDVPLSPGANSVEVPASSSKAFFRLVKPQ